VAPEKSLLYGMGAQLAGVGDPIRWVPEEIDMLNDGIKAWQDVERGCRLTGEVAGVESENVSDTIHGHRGDEPGIVDLFPRHAVCHNEPAPFRINIVSVRQSKNGTLYASNNSVGFGQG
jgi:hypothetical protein